MAMIQNGQSQYTRERVISEHAIRTIVEAIAAGNYITTAIALVGITPQQHEQFMLWGQRPNSHPLYRLYYASIRQAEASLESTLVKHWLVQIPGDWKAAQAFLARRFPKNWGDRSKLEIAAPPSATDQAIDVTNLKNLSDEELMQLEALTTKLTQSDGD